MRSDILPTLFFFASTALGCVKVQADASSGLGTTFHGTLIDDGTKICKGGKNTGFSDKFSLDCKDGYKFDVVWKIIDEDIKATYKTPHGTFHFYLKNNGCTFTSNCCGGSKFILCY